MSKEQSQHKLASPSITCDIPVSKSLKKPSFFPKANTVQDINQVPVMATRCLASFTDGEIIDAGGSELPTWYKSICQEALVWTAKAYTASGTEQRLLPSALLSTPKGMELWNRIITLPTYYQTDVEIDLLVKHGSEIAAHIQPHTIIVDLGCGDVRKVRPLLETLEKLRRPVWYFALDLCRESLVRGMEKIAHAYRYVKCFALWGNFDTGLEFLDTLHCDCPRLYLSLGSIFGNDYFPQAVARLESWKQKALRRPGDAMLLTMDATTDEQVVWKSYHDDQGLFEKFIRNGYTHSNLVLGTEWYRDEDWKLKGVRRTNPDVHIFVLEALKDVTCDGLGINFAKGDVIDCYEAFKYGPDLMKAQFDLAGLVNKARWQTQTPRVKIHQYLLVASEC